MNTRHFTVLATALFTVAALVGATPSRSTHAEASSLSEARELLKAYDGLWTNPDAARLRAAEANLLGSLGGLPSPELVGLLGHGLSTRSVNLVLIVLENAMRGTRRPDYEDALVRTMEAVFEQPDKLAALSAVALRFGPSPENAEVAARLLMKRGPSLALGPHLGGFGARLDGDARVEVKQFAATHDLIEALGDLVDDAADVDRLAGYLGNPATRERARRALETASELVTDDLLRQRIQAALGQ